MVRAPAGAVDGGTVVYNDRYAWGGDDYAALERQAPLWLYAHDGRADYWAADLELHPPRLRYRFGLRGTDGTRWFGWDGLRDQPRPRGAFEFAYVAEGDLPDSPEWARGAIFYHIFPDRFRRSAAGHRRGPVAAWDEPVGRRTFLGGDLDGVIEGLDHVASLSVDAVYLTPIFASPSNHKYDTSDYFTVDPDFGGNAALRRLVAALKGRGMRLILDGVFNHAGSGWPPFVDARRRGADSPYARWFYFAGDGGAAYETWATNVVTMPKLRTSEPELRALVCRIGRFWVEEFGVDGWRLDVANEVDHALWRAFRSAVRAANDEAYLVGEVWNPALPWLRGDQFDSVMNYPFRSSILDFARGATDAGSFLDSIDWLRAHYPEPVHDFLYNLIGSHDAERPLTAVGGDRAAVTLAAALLFTLPGAASIYYGDEVGMAGADDPGCRNGMVWPPERQDARLLALYRRLGRLRRQQAHLRAGRYRRLYELDSLACFSRGDGADRLVVLANAGRRRAGVPSRLLADWLGGPAQVVGACAYGSARPSIRTAEFALPAQSVVVVRRQEESS